MSRRGLIILLHWSLAFMVLAMIKGGTAAPGLRWAFVAGAALWVGMAIVFGMKGKPGPKLKGVFRAAFPWMHRAMYGAIAVTAALNAAALLEWLDNDPAWTMLLLLFVASIFHGIFHLWRHTTLNDGALRMMTPKIWHKYL